MYRSVYNGKGTGRRFFLAVRRFVGRRKRLVVVARHYMSPLLLFCGINAFGLRYKKKKMIMACWCNHHHRHQQQQQQQHNGVAGVVLWLLLFSLAAAYTAFLWLTFGCRAFTAAELSIQPLISIANNATTNSSSRHDDDSAEVSSSSSLLPLFTYGLFGRYDDETGACQPWWTQRDLLYYKGDPLVVQHHHHDHNNSNNYYHYPELAQVAAVLGTLSSTLFWLWIGSSRCWFRIPTPLLRNVGGGLIFFTLLCIVAILPLAVALPFCQTEQQHHPTTSSMMGDDDSVVNNEEVFVTLVCYDSHPTRWYAVGLLWFLAGLGVVMLVTHHWGDPDVDQILYRRRDEREDIGSSDHCHSQDLDDNDVGGNGGDGQEPLSWEEDGTHAPPPPTLDDIASMHHELYAIDIVETLPAATTTTGAAIIMMLDDESLAECVRSLSPPPPPPANVDDDDHHHHDVLGGPKGLVNCKNSIDGPVDDIDWRRNGIRDNNSNNNNNHESVGDGTDVNAVHAAGYDDDDDGDEGRGYYIC
jgi:hypothetical protein